MGKLSHYCMLSYIKIFCKYANTMGPPTGTIGVQSFSGSARQQAETIGKEMLSQPMWTQKPVEIEGVKYIVKVEPHSNAPKGVSFYKLQDQQKPLDGEKAKEEGDKAKEEVKPTDRTVVPPLKTPLSTNEAAAALKNAYTNIYGSAPTAEALSILIAQWAHETGHGKSMYNYNFGGIKGKGPSGLSTLYKTREGFGATEIRIKDYFRAYNNADEGAVDYIKLLERRFPKALEQARQGNSEQFVVELKNKGYFTGSLPSYVKSIKSISEKAKESAESAISANV